MTSFGVVATLENPKIKGVTQKDLIEFETAYEQYKEKVAEANSMRDVVRQITSATIRQSMNPQLLHSLCIMGQIEGATALSEATDAAVEAWFKKRLSSEPKDTTERIRSALNTVLYKEDRNDPEGAALGFVVNVVTALDNNNVSAIIKDKETCESLIMKLINKLEPPELRERVKEERDSWTGDQKSDISYFQSRVSSIAVEVAQGEIARERIRQRGTKRRKTQLPEKKQGQSQHQTKKGKKVATKNKFIKPSSSKETWDKPCLNPDCRGIHRLIDCPNTSPGKKKELFAEFKKKKVDPKKETAVKTVRIRQDCPKSFTFRRFRKQGRFRLLLEGKIDTKAVGDTGSDDNAISPDTFQKLKVCGVAFEMYKLQEPLNLSVALSDSGDQRINFTASLRVSLSITIILPRTNLPIRVHRVPFLVTDQKMDETIIGRPFLTCIGFDIEDHLENVGSLIDNRSFDELNRSEIKLAVVQFAGLKYNAVKDDPIAPVESVV